MDSAVQTQLTFSPKTGPADRLVFWHIISLEGEDYAMKKKKFTEEQIAYALKQAETGTSSDWTQRDHFPISSG